MCNIDHDILTRKEGRGKEIASQRGIIPIVDFGVLLLAPLRGADWLAGRSDLGFDREPLPFQLPVEPYFRRGARFPGARLRPLELEAAGPDSKSSPES